MLQTPSSSSSSSSLITTISMPPFSSSSSSSLVKPKRNPNPSSSSSSSSLLSSSSPCNHSPSAPIDLILLILVLFSCAFLISSSLSHILRSLSYLIPPPSLTLSPLLLSLLLAFLASFLFLLPSLLCPRSRRCSNPKCRGLKKALEFDVQVQTEDCIRERGKDWKEIEDLPWKGGLQGRNPDYEVLRAELRKMAPVNGRAVLLFRARCGCPVAKLEAWGPKRGRQRHKRSTGNLAIEGGG